MIELNLEIALRGAGASHPRARRGRTVRACHLGFSWLNPLLEDSVLHSHMASQSSKVKALQKKAVEKGQWSVVAAASALLQAEDSLDAQINLLGSMHEVGMLSNSLDPYWNTWRVGEAEEAWTRRCMQRLLGSDHDYWALAGLLKLPMAVVQRVLFECGQKLLAVRHASSFKDGKWLIATFGRKMDRTIAPVMEVGWDETELVMEASRWRAVILQEQTQVDGELAGKGGGSYYLRAKLPYGSWRIHEDDFEIKADWLVPRSQTLLNHYPG
jgi:hypothetical protein